MSDRLRAVSFALAFLLVISSARGAQRTFVSAAGGSDSNACTRSAPCRNFGAALLATASNGEIVVLDSGGYGSVTIDRSVSLIAPAGVVAGVTGFTGSAIAVSPGASGIVNLRGLYLNSQGGEIGIDFAGGDVLHVENCVINGFPLAGVNFNRTSAGTTPELSVTDTTIRNGGVATLTGGAIAVNAPGGHVNGLVDGCHLDRYYVGLWASAGGHMVFRNSTAAHNYFGVVAQGGGEGALIWIESCTITLNGSAGVMAGLENEFPIGDRVYISRSMIVQNGMGLWAQYAGAFRVSSTVFDQSTNFLIDTGGSLCTNKNNSLFETMPSTCNFAEQ